MTTPPSLSGSHAGSSTPRRSGARRGHRRATVLLMVIGVLALLSIIAVVYATLGRTDRAVSGTTVRNVKVEDQVNEIADYIAGVIARGTFAVKAEWGTSFGGGPAGNGDNPPVVLRRRASDYPYTDRSFISTRFPSANLATTTVNTQINAGGNPLTVDVLTWNTTLDLFDPAGSMLRPMLDVNGLPTSSILDARIFGSPFLMPIEPTHQVDMFGRIAGSTAVIANAPSTDAGGNAPPPLVDRRDWASISNIFPSGNFVNLANLRNNFNAESGWGLDDAGRPRMSQGLTLYQLYNPSSTGSSGVAFDVGQPGSLNGGSWTEMFIPRLESEAADPRANRRANPLIPADWTINQLFAARPMREEVYEPNDYAYLFNQWADADGDGIADSRWGELVDLSDFFSADNSGGVRAKPVIKTNTRMRLFVAARIIDASGMVNVNTATDSVRMPGQTFDPKFPTQIARDLTFLAGTTPAEVDLRRVLMGVDFDRDHVLWLDRVRAQSATLTIPNIGGLSMIPNPTRTTASQPVEPWDTLIADINLTPGLGAAGYLALQRELLRGRTDLDRSRPNPLNPLDESDLRIVTSPALTRAREYVSSSFPNVNQEVYRPYVDRDAPNPTFNLTPLTSLMRLSRYEITGGTPRGFQQITQFSNPTELDFVAPFDLADELELRTFHGINDPTITSRLEAVVGGRMPIGFPTTIDLATLSPLRDNRPLSLELNPRLSYPVVQQTSTGAGLFGGGPNTLGNRALQDFVLISMFADIRKHLTTVNGARPLIERAVGVIDTNSATSGWSVAEARTAPDYALTLNQGDLDGTSSPAGKGRAEAVVGLESSTAASGNYATDVATDLTPILTALRRGDAIRRVPAIDPAPEFQRLFNFYVGALAPFRNPALVTPPYAQLWPPLGPSVPEVEARRMRNGLAYAGNPELAIRMAAALTVNLADALDTDHSVFGGANPSLALNFNPNPDVHQPTALTLVIDPSAPSPVPAAGTSTVEYPWPQMRVPTDLQPPASSLVAQSSALNVFGLEPQPFLIEVASLFLFANADGPAAGGPPGPGGGGPPPEVTISTSTDQSSNSEFICEILAFQLTNPFDDEIILYDPSSGPDQRIFQTGRANREYIAPRFYFRYADKYYAIIWQSESTPVTADTTRPISLLPGQTRTFYAMLPRTMQEVATRMEAARSVASPTVGTAVTRDRVRDWLFRQFGDPALLDPTMLTTRDRAAVTGDKRRFLDQYAPVNIMQVPESQVAALAPSSTMQPTNPTELNTYFWGDATNDRDTRKIATLWRVMRAPGADGRVGSASSLAAPPANDVANDLMVDRLRDPVSVVTDEGSLFDLRSDLDGAGTQNVAGSDASDPLKNGLTVAFWAKFSRPTGDKETVTPPSPVSPRPLRYMTYAAQSGAITPQLRPRRGILPPWCVEAKSDNELSFTGGPNPTTWSLNSTARSEEAVGDSGDYSATPSSPSVSYATGARNDPMGFTSLEALLSTGNPVVETISQSAYEKGAGVGTAIDTTTIPESLAWRPEPFSNATGQPNFQRPTWSEVAPEIHFVGFDAGAEDDPDSVSAFNANSRSIQRLKSQYRQQKLTSRNAALFSRVGDLLLPMAVCATFDPTGDFELGGPKRPAPDLTASGFAGASASADAQEYGTDFEHQWTTVSEAIALATGYYAPAHGNSTFGDGSNIHKEFGGTNAQPTPGTNPNVATLPGQPSASFTVDLPFTPKLERGCLRIDAFPPYRLLDPTEPGGERESIGTGVPFALNVITNARIAPGLGTTQRGDGTPSELRSELVVGSVDTPTPGKINVNTATSTALSAVPLVKPMRPIINASTGRPLVTPGVGQPTGEAQSWTTTYPLTSGDAVGRVTVPFWGEREISTVTSLFDAGPAVPSDEFRVRWDAATTLQAYRDKMTLRSGLTRVDNNWWRNATSFTDVRKSPADPLALGRLRAMETGGTQWRGLREELGFRSLGEVLAANWRRLDNLTSQNLILQVYDDERSMQRFGVPGFDATQDPFNVQAAVQDTLMQHPALTPSRYYARAPQVSSGGTFDPIKSRAGEIGQGAQLDESELRVKAKGTANPNLRDSVPTLDGGSSRIDILLGPEVPNSYSGKLAMANAAASSLTVRSDVFIVYFLVHGYLPEDTIVNDDPGAGPIEPMVPSLQKRFVMVVDRSNVVKPGDRPKILMLKEVPVGRN